MPTQYIFHTNNELLKKHLVCNTVFFYMKKTISRVRDRWWCLQHRVVTRFVSLLTLSMLAFSRNVVLILNAHHYSVTNAGTNKKSSATFGHYSAPAPSGMRSNRITFQWQWQWQKWPGYFSFRQDSTFEALLPRSMVPT